MHFFIFLSFHFQEDELKAAAEEAKKRAATSSSATGADDVLELNEDGTFDTSKATTNTPPAVTPSTTSEASSAVPASSDADKAVDTEAEDNSPAPEGNGGRTDKYTWTQTLSEVTVNIPLPTGVKSKMLNVDIKNTKLKVLTNTHIPYRYIYPS